MGWETEGYNYKMVVYDTSGNKLNFTATLEDNQYDAEMLAADWAAQGGVEVDWVEVIETDDPQGIIETYNWCD